MPGTLGGSVHVQAVAEGLRGDGPRGARAVTRGEAAVAARAGALARCRGAGGRRSFACWWRARYGALARTVEPDLVLERYHNFGGEGMLAARPPARESVLEVNAPVIDYPGLAQVRARPRADRAADAALARRLVRAADLIVTPSATDPARLGAADRVLEIEWGADTGGSMPGGSAPCLWRRQPEA